MKINKKLTLILPSEASMIKNEEFGLLPRWKRLFDEYKNYFDEVEIYTCDKNDYTDKLGIKHYPCEILVNVKYLKAISYNFWILSQIRRIKPDIIRFFGSVYPLMPLYQMINKVPKVLSYQYDFYKKTLLDFGKVRGGISYYAEKYSVKYIDYIITTTGELQKILKDRYKLNSLVNPNFVDLNIFKPGDEEDFLFFAGRIFHTKGIDLLIQMIRHFKNKGRIIKLFLAGKGDVELYRKTLDREQLTSQIVFFDALPSHKVAEYMAACKIFVFPTTTQEGHPKSLIEALASGAACVASEVLGNTDAIEDGVNGLLIKPGDLNDLIEKVEKLLDDEELRMKIKKQAYISAQKFDIKSVVKREVEVLYEIIYKKEKIKDA